MTRGEDKTSNKFTKVIGTRSVNLEVGSAPHQFTVAQLSAGKYPEDFRKDEIAEILDIFDPTPVDPNEDPVTMTKAEVAALIAEKKNLWEAETLKEAKREKEATFDAAAPHGGLDEFKEIGRKNATPPNAKRGPGRPRKVDREADTAGTLPAGA